MVLLDKYNMLAGSAVLILSSLFGQFWYLFALYLLFNVLDWLTGWAKARKKKRANSTAGLAGLLKKMGYWVMILLAFLIPLALVEIGENAGLDLSFIELLGWFVLASLMVNEARSILENLVELGCKVPCVLIRGLAITQKLIDGKANPRE
jgi:toxin secretion/phage lysis holin